ncbi:polyprotein [Phytophthora megakarya]|uniref:Polyprotein n=1 Tax=Phytophthora megakarya TaxID=4795 RepID=A0A225W8B1_9STRA|nr:polyprotein [Phytophthora megakarya]
MIGFVLARVRCLLTTAHMPQDLWSEAFRFVVEVANISPSNALSGDTPYNRRFGDRPNVDNLRVWGCIAHVFTPKVLSSNKLENPGKLGLFHGYPKNSEGYRILNLRILVFKRSVQSNSMRTGLLRARM